MLGIFGSPQWRTVTGGSRSYVRKIGAALQEVRLGAKVTSVLETADGVEVTDGTGDVATYDAVVIATHPGQALSMLAEPTDLQRELLTRDALLPQHRAAAHRHLAAARRPTDAWASLELPPPRRRRRRPTDDGVVVTYDLTRLQRLDTDVHYLVTLGGERPRRPGHGDRPDGVRAPALQPRLGRRAGAGCPRSTPTASSSPAPTTAGASTRTAPAPVSPRRPASAWSGPRSSHARRPRRSPTGVYDTTISHTRRKPFKRRFTHRSHTWVVDLDDLPDHGVLGPLRGPRPPRRARTPRSAPTSLAFLRQHDVEIGTGKVFMAAQARAFGYCFNPISVFWCYDESGALAATVVEVHNTYGDRHAYLVHPDEQGRATTPTRRCTSRRSTAPTAPTTSPCRRRPADRQRLHVVVELHHRRRRDALQRLHDRPPVRRPPPAARRTRGPARLPPHPRPRHLAVAPPTAGAPAPGPLPGRSPAMTVAPAARQRQPLARPRRRPVRPARRGLRPVARALFTRRHQPPRRHRRSAGDETCGPGGPMMSIHRPEEFFARIGRHQLIGFGEAYLTGAWDAEDLGGVPRGARRRDRRPGARRACRSCARSWSSARRAPQKSSTKNSQQQHRAPLRPVQRPVRAVPRPDAELLLGALRGRARRRPPRGRPRGGPGPQDRAAARPGRRHRRAPACSRSAPAGASCASAPPAAARPSPRSRCRPSRRRSPTRASRAAGFADQVAVELCDYRDVTGSYDAVVSVEMIEAVGWQYWQTYFETIDRVLAPGGRVGIQAITMPHDRMLRHPEHLHLDQQVHLPRRLPALGAGHRRDHPRAHRSADGRAFSMGPHYARDAALWDEAFLAASSGCSSSGSTRPSCGCGTSTSSTPAPASPRATSTSTS